MSESSELEGKTHMGSVVCGHVDAGKCFLKDTLVMKHDGSFVTV